MPQPTFWEPPSDRVAALIRRAVGEMLAEPLGLFEAMDVATLAATGSALAQDPGLADAIRASNRANLAHWATANMRAPGEPVDPYIGAETVGIARDIVRRGFDAMMLMSYRAGQNVAWQYWMERAFELTSDPDELQELLDVSWRSIFAYVDDTLAALGELIERERDQLLDTTYAARREVVNLVLEGAPITSRRASERLRYELSRRHTAAIAWAPAGTTEPGLLEQAADALAEACGARRPFTVPAGALSLWVWVHTVRAPDLEALQSALMALPDVRLAVGPTAPGIEGFRRSHLDAVATQRLLHGMPAGLRLATYEDVQVVALATQDEERAADFVQGTAGPLATAEAELRETVRVYLREGSSATRAARALFTHRNTVLNRIARARELLPVPLEQRALQVALALEIVHWRGAPTADSH